MHCLVIVACQDRERAAAKSARPRKGGKARCGIIKIDFEAKRPEFNSHLCFICRVTLNKSSD